MEQSINLIVAYLVLILGHFLLSSLAMAADKANVDKGEITAIDIAYNTVVVEVSLGGEMYAVGGPISPRAVLRKAGRPAALADFVIGDIVTVKWGITKEGYIVEALKTFE